MSLVRLLASYVTSVLCVVAVFASGARAAAQCTPQWLPGDGIPGIHGDSVVVNAMTVWDPDGAGPLTPRVVVAGNFSAAGGVLANNIASFDPATGAWSAFGTGVDNQVRALLVLPNGELAVGGDFTTAGGVTAFRVAKWNGSTWSPLGTGLSSEVNALARLPSGQLVACTSLQTVVLSGGAWGSLGGGAGGTALAVLPNGNLVVAGSAVASWNGSAWSTLGPGFVNVNAFAVLPNGELVAGGSFTSIGGVAANNIARWNGSTWSAVGGGIGDAVEALAVLPNGDLAAGGWFTTAGGVAANRIATWNGSVWSGLGAGIHESVAGAFGFDLRVRAFAVLPVGDLVAGGAFGAAGGVPASSVARWDGSSWHATSDGVGDDILCFTTLANGDAAAGGRFAGMGGLLAHRVARWNGSTWSAVGSGLLSFSTKNAEVAAVAELPNGDLVAGGTFTTAGPAPANGIARWNGSSWITLGAGLIGGATSTLRVTNLAVLPNGNLIAGYSSASSTADARIESWNGASWSQLGGLTGVTLPGFPSPTQLPGILSTFAVLPNGDLIVGGLFSAIGGVPANSVARWNGSSWSPLGSGLGTGVFGGVRSLAVLPNGDVIAGGIFASMGGGAVNNIARWNGSTWSALGSGIGGQVAALAVLPNGDVVAGGEFTAAGGLPASHLARWDGSAWSAMGAGTNASCSALACARGQLVVAGAFTTVVGQTSALFARYAAPCPASAVSSGAGCAGSGGNNTYAARTLPWLGSTYRTRGTGLAPFAFTIAVTGLGPAAIPLDTLLPLVPPGCTLLASPDLLTAELTSGGTFDTQLALPNTPSLAGAVLHQQLVVLEVDAALAFVQTTSTNAIVATLSTL